MNSRLTLGFAVACSVILMCGGCSSDDSSSPPTTPDAVSESASDSAVETVEADADGSDFCTLLATQVSQGLVNIREAEAGGVAEAESIAAELAAKAPVSQSELQAVAPPEPLGYLQALEEADAKGAAGDFSAMDDTFTNLTALNDWAIANCDSEYTPIFTEYKGVIG